MPDRSPFVGALLRSVPPDRLAEALAEHLNRQCATPYVEVLLGDYTLTRLWPVLDEAAPPGDGNALRCFCSQHPVIERGTGNGSRAHLPLSAWGERLGVLRVETSRPIDASMLASLRDAADEFAIALRAAEHATDRYRRARRWQRLTIGAELQWDILPARTVSDERFQLAGQLEPAYAVCGDHFDWSLDGDRLTVTVLNGHGDGMEASLLTALAVHAMRNARRSGADIVEQAELASEAIHARYGGTRHAAALLLEVDLATGNVDAVDAGSPWALLARGGDVELLDLEQQMPVGMFGDNRYEPQQFTLVPGDRLLLVSDGVHAAAPAGRAPYGRTALTAAVRGARLQRAADAVGTVIRSLRDYHAGTDPTDDAVIVCLDWRP